uniref:Phage protein n=1 Tax=Candidatus Nitrotoga fabula TaxID=2182327 RepID=A0A2X0QVL2_9PROT|nr:protein of unknown function [Candidatus Nitrotoga fabula]
MISIKVDGIDSLVNRLALAPRQIEIATQRAMLKTAHQIKDAEKSEMQRVFDRPTRWTIGSMQVKVVRNMEIKVGIVDPEGAYKRAQSYLGTQVEGGARRQKAMERALAGAGLLPPGWYTVPGAGAKLDQYGNMSVGQIKQILSWFDAANRSAGSQQNMGQAGRDRRRKGKKRLAATENPSPQAQAHIARHASGRAVKAVQTPQRVFDDVDTLDPALQDENATESDNDDHDGAKLVGLELKLATLRLQRAKAELANIEVDKAAGLLVERAEMDFVLADYGNTLRTKLLSLADRLAPAISAHRSDVSAIHAEIEGVAMNILNEISDELSRKMEGI